MTSPTDFNSPQPTTKDESYQVDILQGVSRTFALTIPTLPAELSRAVGNAYLLCRIADTIEDDSSIPVSRKRELSDSFLAAVKGTVPANDFARTCRPLLSDDTSSDEHDLVEQTECVLRITHSLNRNQRAALERCVEIMTDGMSDYQESETLDGLVDLPAMDRYCYFVAGIVGELLTELFCDYADDINAHRQQLMQLSVSFGQGLQMTNILKDIRDDQQRGACWLPQDVFSHHGFDLKDLQSGNDDPKFMAAMSELIGIARGHLRDALDYTLLIPSHHTGIRRFCLWALGMAVLTLRKVDQHRDFSDGQQVKISRRSVKATVALTSLAARSNWLLNSMFYTAARSLPQSTFRETMSHTNLGDKGETISHSSMEV